MLRSLTLTLLISLSAGLFSAEPTQPSSEMPAANIEAQLKEMSIPFTIGKDEEGKPLFRYVASGKTVVLSLYGGSRIATCTSIGLNTTFELETTLEKVNSWNQNQRFLKAYQEKPGRVVLEVDLDFGGDPSKRNLERIISRMNRALLSFPKALE